MSVKAKLIIDEKEINVLWFTFGYNQGADTNGRTNQKPLFLGLELNIETRKDVNLADWSFSSNETKQLELHIYPVILGGKTRKLYFYDCHLIGWKNDFTSTGENPMSETLSISCAGVKDSNSVAEYSSYWRTTFPEDGGETTTLENEKKITSYFLTNVENEEIQDYKKDDIIVLNIETENCIGDLMTIDLDDAEYDFEYNGALVPNDILKNIKISKDLEQIELKVINQKNKE